MEENYENMELENLIIKDKEYYRLKRKKILLIALPIILLIAIIIILIIIFRPKPDNKIICHYQIINSNENIHLININDDIDYKLIINDSNHGKQNSFIFNKPGTYEVTFDFKNKLNSLESFFKGINNLIDANFSQLQFDKITSMANLFKSCFNLKKVSFNNKTPNLENVSNMFHNCTSLDTVYLNFNSSKITKMDSMFNGCTKLTSLDI